MARQVVFFGLAFTAMIALHISCTHALPTTIAPVASSDSSHAPDSTIGTMDEGGAGSPSGSGDVEAAPVGGPVPPGAYTTGSPSLSPSNSGTTWPHTSAVAGAIATTIAGYFF
ncbi:hypothetical protein SAY87_019393 [Trapa incisa]|uniref:Transmembrane protein n=1 Tax=Trapa incisa TaxID=236973 RepID=A0AAN7K4Z3_9MYRT|nr:hypothetical protein SAY87_019393 [Trapa incisa]